MRAMRIAGKVDSEIKVRDKPQHLEKLRVKTQGERLSELSKLEDDLKRQQDQDELYFRGRNDLNKLNLTGTGIYEEKITDPNLIDKILDREKYDSVMVEKQTPIPDVNLNPITAKQMAEKFDFYKPLLPKPTERLEPEIKRTLDEGRTKELLKRLHTDENGKIAITDIGLRETILHDPDNVEIKKIGSNKVALVGKSSGNDNFRIMGNFAPGTGIPLGEHFKTIHGNKYQREQMETSNRIEDTQEREEQKRIYERQRNRERKAQKLAWYRRNKKDNS